MSAILTLPITCAVCGAKRMMKLRPSDAWECSDCSGARKKKVEEEPLAPAPMRAAS